MKWKYGVPTRYFSADTGGGGAAGTGTEAEQVKDDIGSAAAGEQKEEKKDESTAVGKYTDEDIDKLKSDFDQLLQETTTRAVDEALKKAQMKPEEQAEYEQKQRLEALTKREQEASVKELRLDTLGLLAEKQLDKSFLDYVIGSDRDTTTQRIEAFKGLFDKAVQAQVEVRLAGKTPPAGGDSGSADAVRDQFKNAMGGF